MPAIVLSARDVPAADRRRLQGADRVLTRTKSLRDVAAELGDLVPMGKGEAGPA